MKIRIDRRIAATAALAWCLAGPARAEDRPAAAILAEIDAIKVPQLAPAKQKQAMAEKAKLIGELYQADPDAPQLVKLLPMKWFWGQSDPERAKANMAEVDAILAAKERGKLYPEAAYFKVVAAIGKAGPSAKLEQVMPAYEEFIRRVPADPRGAQLLSRAAAMTDDTARRDELVRRIEADYPDSPTARSLAGERRQVASIGKPFDLAFAEATRGTPISMADLKGKVVVIDFWATWCGPCIAEMPTMKKLYAEFKDKGVEFIGVSLDQPVAQGGLDKLKAYVAKNDITWPQYYQGNFWESEFSMSWGVNSIPCVFLIDADGKLATTEARGELERLIPEYLEKAKKK